MLDVAFVFDEAWTMYDDNHRLYWYVNKMWYGVRAWLSRLKLKDTENMRFAVMNPDRVYIPMKFNSDDQSGERVYVHVLLGDYGTGHRYLEDWAQKAQTEVFNVKYGD